MSTEKENFVGPRKVSMAVATDFKTPGGNEVVKIVYEGGYSEIMPKSEFEFLAIEKPTDYTQLRTKKMGRILKEILTVLAEHDLKAADIENLKSSLENELYNSFNRATNYLWTKDDKLFIPGNNVVLERSLIEADIILKSIPSDESAGTEKTGTENA